MGHTRVSQNLAIKTKFRKAKGAEVIGKPKAATLSIRTQQQTTFTLGLLFECRDLFVLTHVRPRSAEEAEAILVDKPRLTLRNGWLWLDYKGGRSHEVCSSYECYCGESCYGIDDCGQWREGLNRESSEDYFAAQLGIACFIKLCSVDDKFNLVESRLTKHDVYSDLEPLD